jgi:hypothetical protein
VMLRGGGSGGVHLSSRRRRRRLNPNCASGRAGRGGAGVSGGSGRRGSLADVQGTAMGDDKSDELRVNREGLALTMWPPATYVKVLRSAEGSRADIVLVLLARPADTR